MRAPLHLWIVGALALVWNAGGAFDYVMTQTENAAYLAAVPAENVAFVQSAPAWFDAAWATGVWGALAGSLLLLLRSRWAGTAFALSLAGLVVSAVYTFGIAEGGGSAMAAGGALAMAFTAAIPLVLVGLLLYARAMTRAGVLA